MSDSYYVLRRKQPCKRVISGKTIYWGISENGHCFETRLKKYSSETRIDEIEVDAQAEFGGGGFAIYAHQKANFPKTDSSKLIFEFNIPGPPIINRVEQPTLFNPSKFGIPKDAYFQFDSTPEENNHVISEMNSEMKRLQEQVIKLESMLEVAQYSHMQRAQAQVAIENAKTDNKIRELEAKAKLKRLSEPNHISEITNLLSNAKEIMATVKTPKKSNPNQPDSESPTLNPELFEVLVLAAKEKRCPQETAAEILEGQYLNKAMAEMLESDPNSCLLTLRDQGEISDEQISELIHLYNQNSTWVNQIFLTIRRAA